MKLMFFSVGNYSGIFVGNSWLFGYETEIKIYNVQFLVSFTANLIN